jgi:hypothetical protein
MTVQVALPGGIRLGEYETGIAVIKRVSGVHQRELRTLRATEVGCDLS